MKGRKGFALIQLMIATLVWGSVVAVAIPGFMQYKKNSKTTEAKSNLKAIANGAISYFESEHIDPAGIKAYSKVYPNCGVSLNDGKLTVTGCKSGQNGIGMPASEDTIGLKHDPTLYEDALSKDPWKSLRFDVYAPFYYYYDYASNDCSPDDDPSNCVFAANASASLSSECDSIYTIRGASVGMIGVIVDESDNKSACNKATIKD